jgi:predicted dehydrogenase
MARDPDVDIVAVTVKVPEHRAIVLAALEAGKHIFCEWPLARDLAEARELAEAARRAGTHVAIGLQGSNSIAVRHASRLVSNGAIGTPLSLSVVSSTAGWGTKIPPHYAYLQDARNGATLATIAGGHTLAMIEAVVGPYREVTAQSSISHAQVSIAGTDGFVERNCADAIVIKGVHDSGCVSMVEIAGGKTLPLRFELQGGAGTLEIRGYHPGGYQCSNLTVVTSVDVEPQPASLLSGLEGAAINVAELYRRLEADIHSGSRTVPDFDLAVKLTQLIDAIETSAAESRTVTLAPDRPGSCP